MNIMTIARARLTRCSAALALCAALLLTTHTAFAQVDEPLTLRLNDAIGVPGGIAAIVVRTYASRGVGQGQMDMPIRQQGLAPQVNPIDAVLAARVFNIGEGGTFSAELDLSGPEPSVLLSFDAPAGQVNERDGPLAVIYVRLIDGLLPGQRFDVGLDLANTFLDDPDGNAIPLDLRVGRLDITSVGAPFQRTSRRRSSIT